MHAIAISVLSVGAVLITLSGVYVMRSKRHSVFKFIKGLFNPISSAFFELTMLVFDISGDVLAFVLVVRKDENISDAFKITYGGFVAFALGISLIAIVVSIARIRRELGLVKKKPDQSNNEDFDNQIKTFHTASSSTFKDSRRSTIESANTTGGDAPQELSTSDTQGDSPVEEEEKIDTIEVGSPVEMDDKFTDDKFMGDEKEPKKLLRKKSSLSDFVIGLNKDDGKNEEEKKLVFAEAFTNLLSLLFEDFPVSRVNDCVFCFLL